MNDFVSNLLSNLIADSIIAIAFGIYISKRIEKKEKVKEEKKKVAVLKQLLLDEIMHNKSQLEIMIENLPIPNLVFPALETTAWENIGKDSLFNTLSPDEVKKFISLYNRTKSINMIYYMMLDKINWIEDVDKPIIKGEFMDNLIDRCSETLRYINKNFK